MPTPRPAPIAPPASIVVGANIHGERVEENAAGVRRVLVGGVWRPEGELEPLRAARIQTPDDARLATASLAIHEVSAAFGHDPARAWLFFGARQGRPVDLSPAALAAIDRQSPAWKAFMLGVEKAAATRSLHLRQHGSVVPVPNWARTIAAPGPGGYPLGLWIGLLARSPQSVHRLDPSDPASFKVPAGRFGKAVEWPKQVVAIDPVDPALAQPWLEREMPGWWLFASAARADAAIAPSHQAQRLEIRQEGRLLGVAIERSLVSVDTVRKSVSVAQFAGDPPTRRADHPTQEPDAFGRVPYRSVSSSLPSEAVAPLRLELAMHHALSALAKRIPDLAGFVASSVGFETPALNERLSPEQVDAVALALHALKEGGGFLLADETGFGKGRTLAALALAGRREGRPVVVVTENANLFSDFYRDLLAVGGPDAIVPVPLHATARIADPNGDVVARGTAIWPSPEPGLFITTYGQLSTDKNGDKAKWMSKAMADNAWLLMDESHNAAGNAVVFEAIEALAARAAGAVFASATFARAEHNLALYRSVLDVSPEQVKRMQQALADDDGLLRQVLVEQLARRGRLLRREHPAIAPPPAQWVDLDPQLAHALDHFQQFWRHLFAACEAFEELSGGRAQVAWLKLGAWLSRTVREFSMLAKTPALADFIATQIANDHKVVVAADLTFEAALRDGAGLTPGKGKAKSKTRSQSKSTEQSDPADDGDDAELEDDLGTGTGLLWRDRLRALLNAVVPTEERSNAPAASPHRLELGNQRALALAALEQLPEWTLSPFDDLATRLDANGIPMGELSGRSLVLSKDQDGALSTTKRQVPDRRALVADFNAGELDAMLLTRAGSTGISLHAGRQFTDQRQRFMAEWGIAADPLVRQQFWGRVRRRDQVCEPGYVSLALDTPFERRVRAREEKKRLRLASFAGHGRAMEPDEVGPEGEALIAEWAADRPLQARRIGVLNPLEKPGDRVDRALVRGIVLPEAEAVAMVERLDRGLAIQTDMASLRRADLIDQPSRVSRRLPWIAGSGSFAGWGVDLVERVMRAPPQANGSIVVQALAAHRKSNDGFVPGPEALAQWKAIWSREPPTSPNDERRKKLFSRFSPLLAWIEPGRGIQLSDPRNGQATRALVMGVQMPPGIKPVSDGASRLAPSQVAVRVFLVGLDRPIDIPLSVLMNDRQTKPEGMAHPSWFDLPASPWVLATLEGDPLSAARSGRHWGCGQLSLLLDETGRERTAWRFPIHRGFGFWSVQPRDMLDIKAVRDFVYSHPDTHVSLGLPLGRHAWLEHSSLGVWLVSDATSEPLIDRDWATVANRKFIAPPKRGPDGQLRRLIAFNNFPRVLHGWQGQGFGFRIPARAAG